MRKMVQPNNRPLPSPFSVQCRKGALVFLGRNRARFAGQAYLETLIVILVLLVCLFGILQAALSLGGRDVLHHAAARAARAKSVGFNDWMAEKAARVAAIPVSGKLLAAEVGWTTDAGDVAAFEAARIPAYLAAENGARAEHILDYEEWRAGTIHYNRNASLLGNGVLEYSVRHYAPLQMPLARIIYPWAALDADGIPRVDVEESANAGEHASLYLEGSRP